MDKQKVHTPKMIGLGLVAVLAIFMAIGPGDSAAAASDRQALVIGNSEYKNSPLDNPANDAEVMARVLAEVGFHVVKLINLDQTGMKKAIDRFGKRLTKDGVALFYFAGHGMQVKGFNYLIPVKTGIQAEEDVEYEAVRADRILAKMESAGTRVNIVILDACRNNPFARSFRSGGQGLAHMDAPGGTIIAYATAPGSTAADGEGKNGLYTSQLIEHIRTPGLTIEGVFKRVRAGVRQMSNKRQTPWESSSLIGNFYFKEGQAQAEPSRPSAKGAEAPVKPSGPRVSAERALTGTVIVVSNVTGAVFNLAGREFKTKAGVETSIDQVPAGPQTVTARKNGYIPWQSTITVEPDQTSKLDIQMSKKGGAQAPAAASKEPTMTSSLDKAPTPQPTPPQPTRPDRDLTLVPDQGARQGYRLVTDSVMGFSVNVPAAWQIKNINEMGDRVIIALSPDQNVAFRVRGFNVQPGVNINRIRSLFENLVQTNMLKQTGRVVNVMQDNLNGMQGVTAVYTGVMNGINVGLTAFFTIQGNRGFILWTIMPANVFDARLPEVMAMAQTFNPGGVR